MLTGHGDDTYNYKDIRINFSSNVYNHFCHDGLYAHLASRMDCIRNYPEPSPSHLEQEIASLYGISPDEVMVTNGATEAIYLIAQAFSHGVSEAPSSVILQPTFSEYADACTLHGHNVISIDNIYDITTHQHLLWLCNPNNPTGHVIPKATLESIITSHPDTTFIIDESYAPFTTQPLIGCDSIISNALLLHSMTKEFAIPGLRLGFISGSAALLNRIRECRMPWSVNQLAIEAAHYLLAHRNEYSLNLPMLMAERKRMADELSKIEGMEAYPSDTHMLLCRIESTTAAKLKDYLANTHGILIRDASNFHGLDEHHFRIAVQTEEEDDLLIKALKEWIQY
ncbi:MAG: pyridoxal phosphate-dependent class II aminotransferase [Prevotellaceae bacterium]|nr:pyridoxal phosphate-dependent class II aminotransferase [Prevotellaceae bacterium]